jgi:hypothetical protein
VRSSIDNDWSSKPPRATWPVMRRNLLKSLAVSCYCTSTLQVQYNIGG